MRYCPKCQTEKDLSCFSSNKAKPSGLNCWCKACSKQASRQHYINNKESRIRDAKERKEKQKKLLKEYVLSLNPKCLNCGESESVCLDFHHIDPDKKEVDVSYLINGGRSFEKVKKEMEKCIILCSNCHRKYHAGLIELSSP